MLGQDWTLDRGSDRQSLSPSSRMKAIIAIAMPVASEPIINGP